HAHLERVAAAAVARGQLEQPIEHGPRDPAAPVVGRDRDVHDVPRVDVAGDDEVADELPRLRVERAEADRRRLRELAGEHRARPRCRIRTLLDALDRAQVGELEAAQLDGHARSTSGTRRYRGSTASTSP